MNIEIIGKNCEVSEHLKKVSIRKLEKLDKYFDENAPTAKVYFKKEASCLKTEISLDFHGNFVRAQAISDNFYDNIDKVLPKIEGQIRKYRTRFDRHRKNMAYKDDSIYAYSDKEQTESKIVKEKQFRLKPMTSEEAIAEMEMLGHSFFVYKDLKTEQIKILYRRSDGELGEIEPIV